MFVCVCNPTRIDSEAAQLEDSHCPWFIFYNNAHDIFAFRSIELIPLSGLHCCWLYWPHRLYRLIANNVDNDFDTMKPIAIMKSHKSGSGHILFIHTIYIYIDIRHLHKMNQAILYSLFPYSRQLLGNSFFERRNKIEYIFVELPIILFAL